MPTGIAIGTIFVVSLVMADFVTVQAMSGGQSASVGRRHEPQTRALLQYPAAAADAVILLVVVLVMVAMLMRTINIRKEL